MSGSDDGHRYTFHIPYVPWHEQTNEQKGLKGSTADLIDRIGRSKPYLEEIRGYLLQIMSERHNPTVVWELASKSLRLIDTEGRDEQEN